MLKTKIIRLTIGFLSVCSSSKSKRSNYKNEIQKLQFCVRGMGRRVSIMGCWCVKNKNNQPVVGDSLVVYNSSVFKVKLSAIPTTA